MGLKEMASRIQMVLRRILHLREKSNLISVLFHDSLSVHFLWEIFGDKFESNCIGNLLVAISDPCLLNKFLFFSFNYKIKKLNRRKM